ncbi:low temperature requirement protein A [Rathayibacter sp. KR2-224]|uniref:low temperature requirement protein A n=1 Tax=Rathayibacter sp. KR2-224 TaxID=3400913 RepID=UPI003C0F874F
MAKSTRTLLRPTTGDGAHRVTYVELFFDLVFVFAVTQLSHILIGHQDAPALLHSVMLAMVVWFAWVYSTWAMSWLNPERWQVSALLFVMMLLGMLVAVAIPDAFGDRAVLFAVSLVVFGLTRSVFAVVAFLPNSRAHALNFVRITCWHAGTGAVWITGALLPSEGRLWVWIAALVLEYAGPRLRFWVPGLGSSDIGTWNVSGEHMAERVSLFLIIALGESIIETGVSFAEGGIDAARADAFLAAFVGTVLLFLLYFRRNERGGSDYISHASERGMIAQTAYTYIPLLLIFGIVASAVADALILGGSLGHSKAWVAGLLCGGAALYAFGNALFRRATGGPWMLIHLLGAVVLVALFPLNFVVPPVALSWMVNAVLLAIVLSDGRSDVSPRVQEDDR